MNIDKVVLDAKRRAAKRNADANVTPAVRIAREPSANELEQCYARPGVGLLLCVHSHSYFLACASCARSVEDAKANLVRFLAKQATQRS